MLSEELHHKFPQNRSLLDQAQLRKFYINLQIWSSPMYLNLCHLLLKSTINNMTCLSVCWHSCISVSVIPGPISVMIICLSRAECIFLGSVPLGRNGRNIYRDCVEHQLRNKHCYVIPSIELRKFCLGRLHWMCPISQHRDEITYSQFQAEMPYP